MRAATRSLLFLVLAVHTMSMADAIDARPYADPLPIGGYVEDIDGLLERAFAYDGWALRSKPDANTYIGFISYKGYDISVRIRADEQSLSLSLVSVYKTGCGNTCEDLGDKPVSQWLVILRRAIALELTRVVREVLAAKASKES